MGYCFLALQAPISSTGWPDTLSAGAHAFPGRTGHLDHLADYHCTRGCHKYPYSAAAAPLTTSIISLVMLLCRTRFMYSVNRSIISAALELAASMAVMRAACSLAPDSERPRENAL